MPRLRPDTLFGWLRRRSATGGTTPAQLTLPDVAAHRLVGAVPTTVLHLWAGNLYGGVETFLATLARCRDLCPTLIPHFGLCFEGRLSEELRATGSPVHLLGPVRLSRPWTVWSARRRLRRVLRAQRIDVVCCHGCWPHLVFAPAAKRAGVRLIHAVHDVLTGGNWIERWSGGTRPDLVLTNSRHTAGSVARVFPGCPVKVNYLPVAAPQVSDPEIARREVRAELGTPANAVVVLQASRLERWKGQSIHVEALGCLRDLPGWEAWFAGGAQKSGEAEFLAELRVSASRAGIADRVRFLGQRSDVPRLMAAANVYCQPNTGAEPFGIVFVEALYAGLPVVTSALGGPLELIDASCGVLVPAGDGAALAEALRRLISDGNLRAKLGAAGPDRAVQRCDPARHLSRLEMLLGRDRVPEGL